MPQIGIKTPRKFPVTPTHVTTAKTPKPSKPRGTLVLKEIHKLQSSTGFCIPRVTFQRLVREIAQEFKVSPQNNIHSGVSSCSFTLCKCSWTSVSNQPLYRRSKKPPKNTSSVCFETQVGALPTPNGAPFVLWIWRWRFKSDTKLNSTLTCLPLCPCTKCYHQRPCDNIEYVSNLLWIHYLTYNLIIEYCI